jgi:beta-lactam-binding protein with PASTA domain
MNSRHSRCNILGLVLACTVVLTGAACRKRVPDLTGKSRADAVKMLDDQKLVVGAVSGESADPKTDTVVDQDPKPGAKLPGDKKVALVVHAAPSGDAKGPTSKPPAGPTGGSPEGQFVTVPDVTGQTAEAAQTILVGAGLIVGTATAEISDQPANKVFDQNPRSGVHVERATPVTLRIAATATVSMPNVVGQPQDVAEHAVEAQGLSIGLIVPRIDTGPQAVGTVLETSPDPNQQIAKNSAVRLVVKQAAATVPGVLGKSLNDAQLVIFQSGLVPIVRHVFPVVGQPVDIVSAQDPVPGLVLAKNANVVITVPRTRVFGPWIYKLDPAGAAVMLKSGEFRALGRAGRGQ